jgi:hypothetical protein
MALIITDIASQVKQLYQNDTQSAKELIKILYTPNESAAFFGTNGRLERTDKRYADMTVAKMAAKMQRFQKSFTPQGDLTFLGQAHPLHHVKVDNEFAPDDFTEEYNSFLEGIEENDRSKWPFVRWYVEQLVAAVNEDKELRVDYKGNRSGSITPGTANFDATIGFGQQVNEWITASAITPQALSVSANNQTFVGQLTDFVKSVRDTNAENNNFYLAGAFDEIIMSPENHEKFINGMSSLYNSAYQRVSEALLTNDASTIQMNIPGTTIKTKALRSMTGSNKIIMTPKFNRFGKVKSLSRSEMPLAGIDKGGRNVWLSMDWWTRVGFYMPQYVFTNDADLTF